MAKIDPQDILIVRNIDTNCDDIDPEDGWSHADFFQVKYAGHPHRIKPGETRRMPRYLAEHFAKHLANHVLLKRGDAEGKPYLMNSPTARPEALSQIIVGVDEYFLGQEPTSSEGEKIGQEVDSLNAQGEEKSLDLGEVPNPAMGVLKEMPPAPPVDDDKGEEEPNKTSIFDENKPKPNRQQLIKECAKLGVEWSMKDTNEQLEAKIKSF